MPHNIYTVRQKKEPFFFCMHLSEYLTETDEFFTYIRPMERRSIGYNSVYLILACVKNFAATVTLNVLCLPVR